MRWSEWSTGRSFDRVPPSWALVYATVDAPYEAALRALTTRYKGLPVFGATSFRGVFTPKGFARGVHVLFGEASDEVSVVPVLRVTNAARARGEAKAAATEILRSAGSAGRVDAMLLHATPGFEERILEGIEDATEGKCPVFGGSAADDDLSGKWRIFHSARVEQEGFVLAGFTSPRKIRGSFVAGYTPMGTVTSPKLRDPFQIVRATPYIFTQFRRDPPL